MPADQPGLKPCSNGWHIEGTQAVLYGPPSDEGEPGWEDHSCDAMGCPSTNHVLRIVDLERRAPVEIMDEIVERFWKAAKRRDAFMGDEAIEFWCRDEVRAALAAALGQQEGTTP